MHAMRVDIVAAFSILATAAALQAAGQTRVLTDGAGRTVTVPASPARIVSLAPSVTELLFALGAGGRVAGVTRFCDYPPDAAALPRIGGLINPDLETIVSLHPDLAIATTSGNYPDDVERIQRLGVPVYTIETRSIESTLRTIDEMGGLLGLKTIAWRLSGGLRERIARAEAEASSRGRPRTLFVIEPEPLIAPGRDTFIGEALQIAGAEPVTPEGASSWGQYDMEQVIAMRPEVILTPVANAAWAERIGTSEEWRRVPAVASGRVFVISDSIQHPGPRLVDGIEEVGRILTGVSGAPSSRRRD